MSKSSELDKAIKEYILDCIESEDNPKLCGMGTDKEKIEFLANTFISEYGHEIKRLGTQKALEEYFKGLPSCIRIAFYNVEILALAHKWGYLPDNATERQEQKILDNYWRLMAAKTCQLFRKYKQVILI